MHILKSCCSEKTELLLYSAGWFRIFAFRSFLPYNLAEGQQPSWRLRTLLGVWYCLPGATALLLKVQRTLDTICDALRILQTETKTATETTVNTLDAIKNGVENNTETIHGMVTNVQRNMHAGEEERAAAKEAVKVGKTNLEMTRQMKNTGQQTNGTISYAAMTVRGTTLAGIPNIQVPGAKSVQTQREVIINIQSCQQSI